MRWIKPLAALLIITALALTGGIVTAGAPLTQEPGVVYRLATYLTSNRVTTEPVSIFPERELTAYHRPRDEVFKAAIAAARARDWRIKSLDRQAHHVHVVARTPVWGFKDDIQVRVTRTDEASSALHITAASRTGLADLGQNTANLIALREAVEARL